MKKPWLLFPLIGQTIILPESSIVSWVGFLNINGLNKIFALPIVSILGNLIVISLFWPKIFLAGPFVLFYRLLKKSRKIVSFFNRIIVWFEGLVDGLLKDVGTLKESERKTRLPLKFYVLAFLEGIIVVFFFIWMIFKKLFIDLVLLFQNSYRKIKLRIISKGQKFGEKTKNRLVKLGYVGVILGGIVPAVPGFRQGGVAAAISIGTNKAKFVFLGSEVVRIVIEIFFSQQFLSLITKIRHIF